MSDPVVEGLREGFQLPPDYTVSEWADRHIILPPETAAEPGRWNTDRAPYQREPMDGLADPVVPIEVWMWSAQTGKTSGLINGIGYSIHHAPAPMMLIEPTLEMAEVFSKDKLAPVIRESPVLSERIASERSRVAENTVRYKAFPGGFLAITGANSPTSLRMRSVKIVWADEVDAYPIVAGEEGDPLKLAHKRTITFWDAKLVAASTPTIKGVSRIAGLYAQSDQRLYFVPCPDCGEFQHLVWERVTWKRGRPETAGYACEHCGTLWSDGDIKRIVPLGEWRATAPFSGVRGYHIWQIYSPWSSLEKIVAEFEEAERKPSLMQVFVNTVLGRVYDGDEAIKVTADDLVARREDYEPTRVPEGAAVVTAGVDVQSDRLEVLVKAYGANNESWALAYLKIYGDPSGDGPWNELVEVLGAQLAHPYGRTLPIEAVAIDSGFLTQRVYDFTAKWFPLGRRWYAIKGVGGAGRTAWEQSKVRLRGGVRLYNVGVDTLKEVIYRQLANPNPGPDYYHFPRREPFSKEFFEMLTVERIVTVHDKRGFAHREFRKPEGARNEPLDLSAYADAAHASLNINHTERLAAWTAANRADATANVIAVAQLFGAR